MQRIPITSIVLASISVVLLFFSFSSGQAQTPEWRPTRVDISGSAAIQFEGAEADSAFAAAEADKTGSFAEASRGSFSRAPNQQALERQAAGWVTIFSDNFEGAFPGDWNVFDSDGATNGEYFWAPKNCRPNAGSYSAWAVGGGADGGALTCGSNYPDNARSMMVYGPFSLADATDAELSFMFWLNSEQNNDLLYVTASINGVSFYGEYVSGTFPWMSHIFDLTNVYNLGDLTGEPAVWVAFAFQSNASTNYPEGAYVDDIELRKYVDDEPTATPTATPTGTPMATHTATTTATPTATPTGTPMATHTATTTATPTGSPIATPTATATTTPTGPYTPTPTATTTGIVAPTHTPTLIAGESTNYLPLVVRLLDIGPTPTPTITPIPSITPTPTQTPIPSATSEGVVPVDGDWSGITSQGRAITLLVVLDGTEVDTTKLTVDWDGTCGVQLTNYYLYDAPISNGHFYTEYNDTWVSGTFTSPTTASGTFFAFLEIFSPYPCTATTNGTWTASYAP